MKIQYESEELGGILSETFEHGCFGEKTIGFTYQVEEDDWITNDDGTFTRVIKKAKLLSVDITHNQ